jgi:hypothetical protein
LTDDLERDREEDLCLVEFDKRRDGGKYIPLIPEPPKFAFHCTFGIRLEAVACGVVQDRNAHEYPAEYRKA